MHLLFIIPFIHDIFHQQEAAGDEKEAQAESQMSEKEFDLAVRKLFDTLPDLQAVGNLNI